MKLSKRIGNKVGQIVESLLGLVFIGGCLFLVVFVVGGLLNKFGQWVRGF